MVSNRLSERASDRQQSVHVVVFRDATTASTNWQLHCSDSMVMIAVVVVILLAGWLEQHEERKRR